MNQQDLRLINKLLFKARPKKSLTKMLRLTKTRQHTARREEVRCELPSQTQGVTDGGLLLGGGLELLLVKYILVALDT